MKKSKKLMLSALALSAFAITTSVILTACSTETTNPGGGTNKPDSPGGDGEQKPNPPSENWEVQNDENKNKDDWTPTNNKIEELQKAFTDAANDETGIAAIEKILEKDKSYQGVDSDLIKTIIDIWTWNIYVSSKKGQAKDTYKSNLKITKNTSTPDSTKPENPTKIDIDFTFSASWDNGTTENKNQTKILKTYKTEDNSTISSDGKIVLKSELKTYIVNGENKLNKHTKTLRTTNEDKITSTEEIIDIEDTLKLYFDNKNINAGSTTPENPEINHNEILKENWITENKEHKKIYDRGLQGFKTNKGKGTYEGWIISYISIDNGENNPSGSIDGDKNNATYNKSFAKLEDVDYLAELYAWIIWNEEKKDKTNFKMDFEVKDKFYEKAKENDPLKTPKIGFEMTIKQSYEENKKKIYLEKIFSLDKTKQMPVAANDKNENTKPSKISAIINHKEYWEDGIKKTENELLDNIKNPTLPKITDESQQKADMLILAKSFYYYYISIGLKPGPDN